MSFATDARELKIYPVVQSDPKEFGGRVNCIFQDRGGFIWIGKENGLFRYDGYELKPFLHRLTDSTTIGGNNIVTITADEKDNLWIGTKGGGLNSYNPVTGQFRRFQHQEKNPGSISHNEVFAIHPDNIGNFWIGTDGGGLNYFSPQSAKFSCIQQSSEMPKGLRSDKILAIHGTSDGKYWIGTWGGGLHLFDTQKQAIEHLGEGTPFTDANIYCIEQVSPDVLWLGSWGSGLLAYHMVKKEFTTIVPPLVIPNFRDLQKGNHGEIWAGSSAGLLYFSSPATPYQLVGGILSNVANVTAIFIDQTNIVWVGCEDGSVGKLNPTAKQFIKIPSSLPFSQSNVSSLLFDHDSGYLYFSTNHELVRLHPETLRCDTYPLSNNGLVSMARMEDKDQLICASAGELMRFDKRKKQFTKLLFDNSAPDGLFKKQIWTISPSGSNCFWVGALGAAYRIVYDGASDLWKVTEILYTGSKQLPVCHYPSCFLDEKHGLMIGTWGGGVSWLNGTNRDKEGAKVIPVSDNFVESLCYDNKGNLWAGTHAGLNRIDSSGNTTATFTMSDGLTSDWIASVTNDRENRIWLSTQKGISSVDPATQKVRNYDFNDGLPANAFVPRAIDKDSAGNFYLGSVRGLVWFHPDSISDNQVLPQPALVELKINDEEANIGNGAPLQQTIETSNLITIKSSQANFSLQMAALGYFNPARNRIKYMLKGYDNEWQMAGSHPTATYSSVPPGTYLFSVVAANEDGIWNNKARNITIVIKSSGTPTVILITLLLIITALTGYAYFNVFTKKSKAGTIVSPEEINHKRAPNHHLIQPTAVVTEPADLQFLQKAILIIEENISNPDFGVGELCTGMCLSRPQLYRKINNIAGVTVTELIKEIRLKRAAQLIVQKPESISEVAYQVGFNDPKYFSKCFKQQFGLSPAHYAVANERNLPPE